MTITTNKLAKAYINPVEKDHIKQNSVTRQLLEVLSSYLQIGDDQGTRHTSRLAAYDGDMTPFSGGVSQVVDVIGIIASTSTSTGNYQANALSVGITTLDPSDYATPILRDAVGVNFGGTIQTGNLSGRVWGANGGAVINPGADGACAGLELFVDNHGSDQATLETSTTKVVGHFVAFSGPVTAGAYFNADIAGGGRYHKVIHCRAGVISAGGTFLSLENQFQVDLNGSIYKKGYFATGVEAIGLSNGLNSDVDIGQSTYLHITGPSTGFSIGGMLTPIGDGEHVTLYNSTTQQMTVTNESTPSTAANRIKTLTGANVVLRAGTSAASFIYDATDTRWILVSSN